MPKGFYLYTLSSEGVFLYRCNRSAIMVQKQCDYNTITVRLQCEGNTFTTVLQKTFYHTSK